MMNMHVRFCYVKYYIYDTIANVLFINDASDPHGSTLEMESLA